MHPPMPARLPLYRPCTACPAVTHPPPQVAEVRAVLKPQDPLEKYPSTARNSIRSRAWAAPIEVRGAAAGLLLRAAWASQLLLAQMPLVHGLLLDPCPAAHPACLPMCPLPHPFSDPSLLLSLPACPSLPPSPSYSRAAPTAWRSVGW